MAAIQRAALQERAAGSYTEAQLDALVPQTDEDAAAAIRKTEFDGDDTRPVVAETDGSVVGWGSAHLEPGVLAATFVDPARTAQGIGTAIVDHLCSVAAGAGLETLTVHASRNAVGFYERVGFRREGEIDVGGPDDPEIPGEVMRRSLS